MAAWPDRKTMAAAVLANLPLWFEPQVLAKAMRYARDAVLDLHHEEAAHRLDAVVQGSEENPYEVTIDLPRGIGGSLESDCTCPYGIACKHGAAALMVWARRVGTAGPLEARAQAPRVRPPARSREIDAWLQQVRGVLHDDPQKVAAPAQTQLRYVLAPASQGLQVGAVKQRLRKDGSVAATEPWTNFQLALRNPPSFATEEDLAVFAAVARFAQGAAPVLAGKGADNAVRTLLACGRSHWRDAHGPTLVAGQPRQVEVRWTALEGGHRPEIVVRGLHSGQNAEVAVAGGLWVCVPGEGGVHAEFALGQCALPGPWLRMLAAAPELDDEGAARFRLLTQAAGWPQPGVQAQLREIVPQPVLTLRTQAIPAFARRDTTAVLHGAELAFRYGDVLVPAGTPADEPVRLPPVDGVQMFARRDVAAEHMVQGVLPVWKLQPARPSYGWNQRRRAALPWVWQGEDAALAFVARDAVRLERDGWAINYAPDWPLKPMAAEEISGRAQATGVDWFELSLGVRIGRERFDLAALLALGVQRFGVAMLREALARPQADEGEPAAGPRSGAIERLTCPLPDGRLVALPIDRVRGALALFLELFDTGELPPRGEPLRLSRFDLARLARMEQEAGAFFSGSEPLLALARRLRQFKGIDAVPTPTTLKAQLRDYQAQGLAWMQFLREYGLAGVLADEMGLGKTVQTLAHVLAEQAAGRLQQPVLVVAPASVVPNWEREAARFAPSLKVLTVTGQGRGVLHAQVERNDLVLTHYALLARDAKQWLGHRFHLVVLDEAQAIKNAKTQAAQAACALQASHRLALSGTPLENHLGEAWSLFRFLLPGFLGEEKRFDAVWRRPIEKHGDTQRRSELAARLSPFILRRTKDQVARELPPRTEARVPVRMGDKQAQLYETVRATMDRKVQAAVQRQGLARSRIAILDALLKLRQACCDPRLLPAARGEGITATAVRAAGSAKLEALMELLAECRESGRRALVFSQFTGMLDLIEPQLQAAQLRFVRLDGDTRDRRTPVDRFQAGEAEVFLLSLKAGGTGLNLTAADTVVHYDPWWNPAVEAQATARAHRIGQDKPVFVYRLVCEGSVEEKILALQERKAELAAAILEGSTRAASEITAEDLRGLFASLPPGA